MHVMLVRSGFAHRFETPESTGRPHESLVVRAILAERRVRGLAAEASALRLLFQFRHNFSYPVLSNSAGVAVHLAGSQQNRAVHRGLEKLHLVAVL
jgi:hypothetical protein